MRRSRSTRGRNRFVAVQADDDILSFCQVDVAELDVTASFRCIAHKLQLAVGDLMDNSGVDDFVALVARVREFVVLVRASPLMSNALKAIQRAAKNKPLNLVLDVKTRWLSLHAMLERFDAIYVDIAALVVGGQFDAEFKKSGIKFVTPAQRALLRR